MQVLYCQISLYKKMSGDSIYKKSKRASEENYFPPVKDILKYCKHFLSIKTKCEK